MSGTPSLTILPEEQKFNGENLLQWKTTIKQLLASKGLLGYATGTILKPTSSTTTEKPATEAAATPIYSSTPTLDEWVFRDGLARGHITLNCADVISLGVATEGTAKEAWDSIQAEWGKSTDMRRSQAQEALYKTVYVEGTDILEHVKVLRMRKAAVDNLNNSPMDDDAWRGFIIRSIPPTAKWLPLIPSLYALSSSADVISTLSAHGMTLERDPSQKSSSQSNTALVAKTAEGPSCTNPQCKAMKRSTHTINNCYWPGGGKEGQFPPNFGQKSKANTASSTSTTVTEQTEHFALTAGIPNTPGQSGILIHDDPDDYLPDRPERNDPEEHPLIALISKGFQSFEQGKVPTFLDSGASDTMFVSKDAFANYKPTTSRMGDSAKADDGGFEIVGEGSVYQRYRVDGKDRDITYTRALHAPTLNANLVSISALDKAGLITTFGHGRGVVRKEDGKVVLAGSGVNGMYLLEQSRIRGAYQRQ